MEKIEKGEKFSPRRLKEAFIVGACLIIGVKWGENKEKGGKSINAEYRIQDTGVLNIEYRTRNVEYRRS